MVAAIRREFEKKMADHMGEPYSKEASTVWRRIWDLGLWAAIFSPGNSNKVKDFPV
jgi:hypothetical protein